MGLLNRLRASCKGASTYTKPAKPLLPAPSRITRTIAYIAAAGLVLSSAGFGAVFAYQSGLPHGPLFAALMVAMAVSLELAKPLAVSASLAAFRSWSLGRGVLLAALAAVAVAYSLTAELQLVSSSRGDLVAKREAAIEQTDDRRENVKAARAELAMLAKSRTIAEVQADIAKLLADNPKAGDCTKLDGPVSRSVCPQVATLKGEIARTERRAQLQGVIDKGTAESAPAAAVKSADPGSAALATYLATIGINVAAAKLSDWLVLVPVVALELGAALAMVLVQAVSGPSASQPSKAPQPANETASQAELTVDSHADIRPAQSQTAPAAAVDSRTSATEPRTASKPRAPMRTQRKRLGQPGPASREAVKLRLVDSLKAEGGKLDDGSVRGVAKLIGAKKSTVHNAVAGLVAAGVVAKVGTGLVLVAA